MQLGAKQMTIHVNKFVKLNNEWAADKETLECLTITKHDNLWETSSQNRNRQSQQSLPKSFELK